MIEQDWKDSRCTFCGELDKECTCPDYYDTDEIYDDSEPYGMYESLAEWESF